MRGLMHLGGMILACAGCAFASIPAAAQGSYSQYDESATAALARYVRDLAADPKDFTSLIGAGRAALVLGDAEAAAGFFARADAVNPSSPLPQAGMGGVSVLKDDPQSALSYFERAVQLGATLATIGCDRGLAYDLLGRQAEAQADYRAAMNGPDREEARRRLALSLAISGNRAFALQTLSPLMAKRDPGAERARAFVLALDGNPAGALAAINAAMPGSSDRLEPFLERLSSLSPGQKAAAINLGIFPESTSYAYSEPPTATAAVAKASNPATDRLASIDAMLNPSPPAQQQAPAQRVQHQWSPAQTVQLSYARPSVPTNVRQQPARSERQVWLQLASGTPQGLSSKYRRLRGQDRELFSGITPYLANSGNAALLLIGPFKRASDADFFAEDLETLGVHSSKYINSQTDRIAPLAVE